MIASGRLGRLGTGGEADGFHRAVCSVQCAEIS